MCDKRNTTIIKLEKEGCNPIRVDKCLAHLCNFINEFTDFCTITCCCGHSIYPPTLLVTRDGKNVFDVFSYIDFEYKKRYYKSNENGYYFIPEVIKKAVLLSPNRNFRK